MTSIPEPQGKEPPSSARPRRWSIRTQIILLLLGVLVPLAALGTYAVYSEARVSATRAERGALALAEVTAANLGQFLHDAEGILADLATAHPLRQMNGNLCSPLLRELETFLPQFTNVFVTDLDGTIRCSALPVPQPLRPHPASEDWFHRVLAGETNVLGRPYLDPASERWSSIFATPIVLDDGTVAGTVALAIDLVRFQTLLTTPSLPPDAVITIDDLDGTVVARSVDPEAWVGRRLPASGLPARVLEQEQGITRVPGAEGIERVWAFTTIPDTEWRVWAGIPTAWIYAPVREAAMRNGLVGLSVFLLVGVFAFFIYRGIASSLVALVEGTRLAARGRPEAIPLDGPAEVVEVARQFGGALEARIRAEERHRRAEERYRSVVENAAFGIYVATPDGRIIEANPALARILGCASPEELEGRSVAERFRSARERREFEALQAARRPIGGLEATWSRFDGTAVAVRLNGELVRHGEASMAYEVIAQDVSERRRLEEQVRHAQKMEAVGSLAGGVAHDFNNLLTVVTNEAHELLHASSDEDSVRDAARQIVTAAERGASLVSQLLAFSRRQVLQPRVVELNGVVAGNEDMLRRMIGVEHTLRIQLAPDSLPVRIDPIQMEQVLMNLVLNAKDALDPGGGGTIGVRTGNVVVEPEGGGVTAAPGPGRYATLEVRDDGVGIPPELHARLFEPFFTTKPEGRGTGLGLATVYGIATQSGGHVEFRSEPETGTEFTVYLPLVTAEAMPTAASAAGAAAGVPNPASASVSDPEV